MNVNRMKAAATRHRMEMEATLNRQPQHSQHIRDYCDYADATAEAAASEAVEGLQRELKPQIEKEITRQIQQGKVSVAIDKASVKTAKKAIDDLHAYIKKVFK